MGTINFEWPHGGKMVLLAGTFNNWNKGAMLKEGNKFIASVGCRPGEYEYKFLVDGHWCIDHAAPSRDDGHGNIVNYGNIVAGGGAKGQVSPRGQQQPKQQQL